MYGPEVQQSAFERGYMKGYADALAGAADAEDALESFAPRVVEPMTDRAWPGRRLTGQ